MKKRLGILAISPETAGSLWPYSNKILLCLICLVALVIPHLYSQPSPETGKVRQTSAGTESPPKDTTEHGIYIVRKGDSLYGIADAQGTTVKALQAANHLKTIRLQIGQRLTLPAAPNAKPAVFSSVSLKVPEARASGLPEPASSANHSTQGRLPDPGLMEIGADSGTAPQDIRVHPAPDLSTQPLRYRLASAGLELLGARYRWNGNSESNGFDCSGLVKCLFDKFKIGLPRSSREQFKQGETVDKDKLEVGDLVFFSSRGKIPNHVGIYIGDNQFIHAALRAKRVLVSNLTAPWYNKRFLGARRLTDLWAEDSQPDNTNSK
jgi:cell wall-associated NlpC family hydrolase